MLGAFNMNPRANVKLAKETADIPTTQDISDDELTKEENDHHFLRYQGYCSQ
jgi:hypothetical protein